MSNTTINTRRELSAFEERAFEALRTTQAIAKTITQESTRLGRVTSRTTDPEKARKVYHAEIQALMAEHLSLARQAVRMAKELAGDEAE